MKFNEILKEIMIERNLSVKEISEATKIDDSIIYDQLNGSIPNIKNAVKLANFLNCSLNYLIGLDDTPNKYKFKQTYDISLFFKKYKQLLTDNKTNHYRLTKQRNLNYSSYYEWKNGAIPSINSLYIIAEYFGVSIDYLIGRSHN